MRRPLVIGNWKMHTDRETAISLARSIVSTVEDAAADVVISPPFPWLVDVAMTVTETAIAIGAQDCSRFEDGPHTGEVSAAMLAPWCRYVLLGHSERRADNAETDAIVGEKMRAALAHGLRPVLCVGEVAAERDSGRAAEVVSRQLAGALAAVPPTDDPEALTVAYEPAWAIGTGTAATPEDAAAMVAIIRSWLEGHLPRQAATVRVLYGGSVSAANAAAFAGLTGLDGLLVGSASLDREGFAAIIAAASAAT